MIKISVCLIICMLTANCCCAAELPITDIIRRAREAQVKQQMAEKTEESLKPVKNEEADISVKNLNQSAMPPENSDNKTTNSQRRQTIWDETDRANYINK